MNKDDLLYHYFSNSLSEAQEEQLQELLETDTEFKKRFDFESNLKRVTKEKRHQNLRNKLQGFEVDIQGDTNTDKPQTTLFSFIRIAASVVILVAAGWLGYQSFFSLDYSELYSDNFERYPNTVYSIERDNTDDSLERRAFLAYESGEFKTAISLFDQLESTEYADFYKAQSLLSLKEIVKAKQLFQTIENKSSNFKAASKWYLALIAINEEQKDIAIDYLTDLIANHSYKKDAAETLLKQLN